jgi:hypothetical protein
MMLPTSSLPDCTRNVTRRAGIVALLFACAMLAYTARVGLPGQLTSGKLISRGRADQAAQQEQSGSSSMRSIKPIFAASGTDKLPRHGYHRFYDQVLQHLYGHPIRMVEIGVLDGDSLKAWQTMFDADKSTIYGISWPETVQVKNKLDANVHVLYRDQSNCMHLDDIARTVGEKALDLVIDDGSHEPGHQLKTLVKLFPRVAPGGLYVIEDIETSYWDAQGASIYGYGLRDVGAGRRGSIMTALKLLAEVVNQRYAVNDYDRTFNVIDVGVDPDVAWVMFAQNMVVIRKKDAEDKAYEVPIDHQADGSTWKAFWGDAQIQDVVHRIREWKCA